MCVRRFKEQAEKVARQQVVTLDKCTNKEQYQEVKLYTGP